MLAIPWLLASIGCVLDLTDDDEVVYSGDSGGGTLGSGEACVHTAECALGLRCDGQVCTAGCIEDDECPDHFACARPGMPRTDPDGCYERCGNDYDCQAGFRCDDRGACTRG